MDLTHHPITGCRTDQLFGLWLMESDLLSSLVLQANAVDLKWLVEHNAQLEEKQKAATDDKPKLPYVLHDGGIAEFLVKGPTTKYPTSFQSLFGGTSTLKMQESLRAALKDDQVKGAVMTYETPGGSPNGLWDLGADIRKFAAVKPLASRIQDQGTSAGYYLASQGGMISCNENAQVGSIGVVSRLVDTSGALEKNGIRVIPIRSGKLKAPANVEGAKISDDEIKDNQRRSDELWDLFARSVAGPRRLTTEYVKGLEAKTFIGAQAKKFGLVDHLEHHEETLDRVRFATGNGNKTYSTPAPVVQDSRSGTAPGLTTNPTAANKKEGNLMADLLAKLRELHNKPSMTEEEAEQLLVSMNTQAGSAASLTQQLEVAKKNQKPEPIAPALLDGYKKLAAAEIALAVKAGTLTDAQAGQLTELAGKTPELSVVPLEANGGQSIVSQFIKTAELAPKGVQPGTKTGDQGQDKLRAVDPNPQNADEFSVLDEVASGHVAGYKKDSALSAAKA